jgi:DNA-binding NarL/FixJ family response regulator
MRRAPTALELLDCLARGWTRQEIAEDCGLTYGALQMRLVRLRHRMHANSREHMMSLFAERREACEEWWERRMGARA